MPAAVVVAVGFLAEYGILSAATAFAIGSFAATYGAAIMFVGALAYSASEARKAKSRAADQYNAAQVDRMASISSSVAPRELVLGRVRKGGAVFFKASTGGYQKDLYLAIALAGHEIDAVETIYLNDTPVTLDVDGFVTTAPYNATKTLSNTVYLAGITTHTLPSTYVPGTATVGIASGPEEAWVNKPFTIVGDLVTASEPNCSVSYQYQEQASNVQIFTHLGQPGQVVDAALLAAFPAAWPSANVVDGVAYLVVKLTYSETSFPNGIPAITTVLRGAKVFDPRSATTAWSQNPALLMRHVYQHAKFGKATVSAAEDARIIAAANACDASTIYTVGGVAQPSRALYKADITAPFGTPARSLLDDLAQAMGGSWAHAGGELYLKPGTYTAPVIPLTDADLAVIKRDGASESQSPIKISTHRERANKFNTVKVTIWDQAQDYKQAALTPLVGSALLARDGAELVQEVTYPAIGYAPQALHVAGVMMRDARDPLTVELPFKLSAYPVELFDTVALTLARYGWAGKTFMVLQRSFSSDGSLSLMLKETTAAIVTMDAGFAAQGFAANTNLPEPWSVASVGALAVTSGTSELLKQADGTVVSRLRITWTQVPDQAVVQNGQVEVQYRRADSNGAWTSLVVAGNETSVATTDVQDGMGYIIRARAKTTIAVGDWGTQVAHTVLGKSEPPPPFDTFTVLVQPDGTRQFNFSYASVAAQPYDWLGAEIRYVSGNVPSPDWGTMTPLQDGTTYHTSSPIELNAPLAGEYTFACRSLDTSGNLSTYLVTTITLPARRTGDVFDEFYEHAEGWSGTKTGFHVQGGYLEANDSTTWATAAATWAGFTRWNTTPASPAVYETPARDFGTVVTGQVNSTVDADGSVVQELATSADGTTWSAWGSATATFSTRFIKLRLTVTATGPAPVPMVRSWAYQINAPVKTEYINDVVISSLTGSYRIGVGDIRIPLVGSYSAIKRTGITIQDSSAGTWTYARIDQSLSPAPRWQFRLNGALADPAFVDFFIEGY